jgi:AraC-like DNA-binding protein
MPLLNARTSWTDFQNPDDIPRPVTVAGIDSGAMSIELELAFHTHRKAQLAFVARGLVTCESRGGLWTVPPHSALWIPADEPHRLQISGQLEAYAAFLDPARVPAMPGSCRTVEISPLLRELLVRCAALPMLYAETPQVENLQRVLIDEVLSARVEDLFLPMPTDPRVRRLAELLTKHPADPATLDVWARRVGVSERTLHRILASETGMSFGRWRKQLHIILALRWMSAGVPVQTVAIDLGYEEPGSFITMFRKALGLSPARFMARRLAGMQRLAP